VHVKNVHIALNMIARDSWPEGRGLVKGVSVTAIAHTGHGRAARRPSARTYLMCPPTYFTVSYAINPWMDPAAGVDADLAHRQWDALCETYARLGHMVHLIDPVPGLPDMVFAANGATVVGGKVLGARFRHRERAGESGAYLAWFRGNGFPVVREPITTNEGEGDLIWADGVLIAGYGFRTELAAREELQELFQVPVVSVRLADPRFYHLDTALAVLDSRVAAYYPGAFDGPGRAAIAALFDDLIEVTEAEAAVFGLNAVSDGHRVVLPAEATGLAAQLARRGFEPVPVDMSEFRKAGGGPKCCTLELRS
jgi:arginine dihydrolase